MCDMHPAKGMWYCATHKISTNGVCPKWAEAVDNIRRGAKQDRVA